jgi:hypothetical protein
MEVKAQSLPFSAVPRKPKKREHTCAPTKLGPLPTRVSSSQALPINTAASSISFVAPSVVSRPNVQMQATGTEFAKTLPGVTAPLGVCDREQGVTKKSFRGAETFEDASVRLTHPKSRFRS